MGDNSTTIRLGDVAVKIGSGATPKGGKEVYKNSGVALIRSQNVYNYGFSYDGLAFIGEKHARQLENVTVEPEDILLNITGDSVARVCQVPNNVLPARVNQHVVIIRPNQTLVDARFLRYFLTTPEMQARMLSLADSGGTRKALTKGMIEGFQIPNLPIATQRAIAHLLGTLDDKIELNRRMNHTLEETARAIFKSWFVDFDPVRAKIDGRECGLPGEIMDLFPDVFEDSALGKIPKGWRVGKIGDVAKNIRRTIHPGEIEGDTPYIGLQHMPQKSIALSDWGKADEVVSNKFGFKTGEILFGKLRSYFHKVGVAPLNGVCSTDILVVAPKVNFWFGFLLGHVSSVEFVDYTTSVSTGTRMPRTNWPDMARFEIVLPPENLANVFNAHVLSIVETIRKNIHQSRSLAFSRDSLLPRLMSGEIQMGNVLGQLENEIHE